MVTWYLDASVVLKRYVNETGSDWVRRALATPHDFVFVSSQLTIVEVISGLNRRVRERAVTFKDYARLSGRFRDDCRDLYPIIALDDAMVTTACALLERHPLRAYDAVHLATALTVNRWLVGANEAALVFLAAADRLLAAASAEGLGVDNPNHH